MSWARRPAASQRVERGSCADRGTPRAASLGMGLGALVALGAALLSLAAGVQAATTTATIQVDVNANRHAIDPRVYGIAYGTTAALSDLNVPLNRYGGNNTSRYNWQQNADNRGSDWYFESIADDSATPGERGDTAINSSRSAGAEAMLTIPMVGWVAKVAGDRSKLCSFSIAKYGSQTGNDWQWFPDAGNGVKSTGGNVTNTMTDANVAADSTFQQGWVQHLVTTFGTANNGGQKYYILDNEPGLWHGTHRDVHPVGAHDTEIRDKIEDYAAKIRAVDPNATIVGPEEWGWTGYLFSGYDQQKATWGNMPDHDQAGHGDFLPWLLTELKAHDQGTGQRSLDVFTVHYYPQSGEFGGGTDTNTQLLRNQSTRSLWDPNYVDQSWINDRVELIPRLKNWVSTYYPGLETGITEYNWGAEGHINGATAQADVLGIFGREDLDLAARWTTPDASTPTYKAMKLYRNYDGNKSAFGDVSVSATGPNPDDVAAFAAQRTSDNAVTVMVINKQLSTAANTTVNLANYSASGPVERYQLTSANVISHLTDLTLSGNSFSTSLPAQSITLFVVGGTGGGGGGSGPPLLSSTASGSPASVAAGATTTIGVTVTNNGGDYTNGNVDLEIYDASDTQVAQHVFSGSNVTGGTQQVFNWDWTAPATTGTYTLKVGLFDAGWTTTYDWNNAAGTVTVTSPSSAAFNLSAATYSGTEASGTATLTVNRTGSTTGAATLHYHTTAGTAADGADYTGTTDSTVSFANGDASKTISVPVAGDVLLEGNETFTVTLDSTSAGSIGATAAATVTISDDLDAPKPTGVTGSVSGANSVLVTFTDRCTNETGFTVERAPSGGSFSTLRTLAAKTGTGAVSFTDGTAASGNTYFYRVRAENASATSNTSANGSVTVGAPTAPVLTSVTVLSCRQVRLAWQDKSNNELNFKVEGKPSGGSFTSFGTPPANSTTSSPGGLTPGTDYTFHVLAQNGAGSSTSNEVTVHTWALPNPPVNVSATALSGTQIRLLWSSGDAHSDFWQIERSTDGTSFSLLTTLDKSILRYTDSGLPTGSTRYYRLRAVSGTSLSNANLYGVGGPSAVVSATTFRKPNPPTNLAAAGISASQIRLSWQNGDTNTDYFRIERQSGASWLFVTDVGKTVLFYTVNNLPAGQSFTFRVSAIAGTNLTGPQWYVVSDPAGPVTASTWAAPAAPTNLTATAQAGKQILLAWSDNATSETGYRVERSTDGTNFTEIAQLIAGTTGYRNTGLTTGVTYTYRVRAVSGSLFSAYSGSSAATALP